MTVATWSTCFSTVQRDKSKTKTTFVILIWIIKFWHSLSEKHFEKCTLEHIAYILTDIKIQYIEGGKIAQQCREFVVLAEDHIHIKK